ncbi:MAG: ABC transporter substrate-binding protein [Vicinamibacteria bacterium]|nr:ABC transporter substrate-binding protein [Vicinamibacteria bacterium]
MTLASAVACGPQTSDRTTIHVALQPRLANAALLLALDAGDFAAEGLSIRSSRITSTNDALPALDQGRVDVGVATLGVGVVNAVSQGAHLRIVAERGHATATGCQAWAVLARPGLDLARVRRAQDLAALRASCNPVGHSGFLLDRWLAPRGLRVSDLPCDAPHDSLLPDLLARGALDVGVTGEPYLSQAVARGATMLETVDPGEYPVGLLLFGRRLLEERELGVRFVRAYQAGIARYLEGKTADNLDRLARLTGIERGDLERSCWAPIHADGHVAVEPLEAFVEWAHAEGQLERRLPAARLVDPGFVRDALRR